MRDVSQEPLRRSLRIERLSRGEPNLVVPARRHGTLPLIRHSPLHGERLFCHSGCERCDIRHRQVCKRRGRRRRIPDDDHLTRFIIVVVDLIRIVRVDVGRQRVFQHHIVGVAPRRNVIGIDPGPEPGRIWDGHRHRLIVKVAGLQRSVMSNGPEENIAFPGKRSGLVDGEPDRVGPG